MCVAAAAATLLLGCVEGGTSKSSSGVERTGTGGSMARFAIVDDRLYALTDHSLQLFDVTDSAKPQPTHRVGLDFSVETLFAYRNYLFIGGPDGMYVYDNTDPAAPTYLSQFQHARACDPVVVQGDYAYITLHSGGCWGNQNLLEIVDLTNMQAPALVSSVAMQSPTGLAVDGDKVFVCDDIAGLKTLSVADPTAVTQLDVVPEVNCYDLIARDGNLVVSSSNALRQYSYLETPLSAVSSLPTAAAPAASQP
jgi:hypothetical protein